MTPLKESILKSTGVGRMALVEKWLEDNNLTDCCRIEKDYSLTVDFNSFGVNTLLLSYQNYDELPYYIKFNPIERDDKIIISKFDPKQNFRSIQYDFINRDISLKNIPSSTLGLEIISNGNISDLNIEIVGNPRNTNACYFSFYSQNKYTNFKNSKVYIKWPMTISLNTMPKGDLEITGASLYMVSLSGEFESMFRKKVEKLETTVHELNHYEGKNMYTIYKFKENKLIREYMKEFFYFLDDKQFKNIKVEVHNITKMDIYYQEGGVWYKKTTVY